MKIILNETTYELSQVFKDQFLTMINTLVRTAPFEELHTDDQVEPNPLVYIDLIAMHFLNKYSNLPMLQKTVIMAFVRGQIASMEQTWGSDIRPARGSDPVLHIADFFMKIIEKIFDTIREEVIPHGVVEISISDGQFTGFALRKDSNQAGGTVVADGDIGIRQNDGGEADRQAIATDISTNETLYSRLSGHGRF